MQPLTLQHDFNSMLFGCSLWNSTIYQSLVFTLQLNKNIVFIFQNMVRVCGCFSDYALRIDCCDRGLTTWRRYAVSSPSQHCPQHQDVNLDLEAHTTGPKYHKAKQTIADITASARVKNL